MGKSVQKYAGDDEEKGGLPSKKSVTERSAEGKLKVLKEQFAKAQQLQEEEAAKQFEAITTLRLAKDSKIDGMTK